MQFSGAANSCQVALVSKRFHLHNLIDLISTHSLVEILQHLFSSEEIILDIFKAFSGNKQTLEHFSTRIYNDFLPRAVLKELGSILAANYSLQTCVLSIEGAPARFKKIMRRNKALQSANRFKKTKLAANC